MSSSLCIINTETIVIASIILIDEPSVWEVVHMMYRFMEPMKKERNANYGTNYFVFQSRKLGRDITAFSKLAFDHLICLEMDYEIEWYCERPLIDVFYVDGKNYSINPTVYVKYRDNREEFHCVRYGQEHGDPYIQLWAAQHNEYLKEITEKDVYVGPFYSRNLLVLATRSSRWSGDNPGADANIIRYLTVNNGATIGELSTAGLLADNGLKYLADLFFRGKINFPEISNMAISNRMGVVANGI